MLQPDELIDLDTFYELKKNAPRVMNFPVDAARWLVEALASFKEKHAPHEDLGGQSYWQASLKELSEAGHLSNEFSPNQIGRACRALGLASWRKGDGYHVAWSATQLRILKKHFKA